jgi:hypothetical protein
MRSTTAVLAAAILVASTARAQEPESRKAETKPSGPEGVIASIEEEFKVAQNEFFREYRNAKTDEEKDKLYKEKYPKPSAWFPRLFDVAKADPKGPGAEKALIWIVTRSRGPSEGAEALDLLRRDHIASKNLARLADALVYLDSPKADEFLVALEQQNPNREIKGRAVYSRAKRKQSSATSAARVQAAKDPKALKELEEDYPPEELVRLRALDVKMTEREFEELLLRVEKEFGDVDAGYRGTLADRAGGDLFEMRNLGIGKVAPPIEGEGVDGKPLKLSDFKGKVVILDFWGHW